MNPYELLKAHVAEHKYTRGKNKGSAPLDSKRRHWLAVVAKFKWDYKYVTSGAPTYNFTKEWFPRTRQATWTHLRSTLTKGMNKIITTTDVCI